MTIIDVTLCRYSNAMYNKLFTKILDSSIWLENQPTRIVWITFIACMDQDGTVALSSVGNVANRARVSFAEAEAAIECLESPDEHNPDQEYEGRRIERIPGLGWSVLNAKKYRDIVTAETVRAQNRERQRRYRSQHKQDDSDDSNVDVTPCHENVTLSEAEAETKAEAKEKEVAQARKTPAPKPDPFPIPRPDVKPELWSQWLDVRKKMKKPLTQIGYDRLIADLGKLVAFDINERLELAIDRKWQGLIFNEDKNGAINGTNKPNYHDQRRQAATEIAELGERCDEILAGSGITI